MKTEHSAGIIIYRKTKEGPKFLLLYHGGPYWNFPKGKLDGESNFKAALREVHEETGILEINLFLRGREKGNKDWGLQKLNEFLAMITVPHQVTLAPKPGGRGFITQVTKK